MRTETMRTDNGIRVETTFDDKDRCTRAQIYDNSGTLVSDARYTFDSSGRASGGEVVDGTGKLLQRYEKTYTGDGEETRYYAEAGRLLSRSVIHGNGASGPVRVEMDLFPQAAG